MTYLKLTIRDAVPIPALNLNVRILNEHCVWDDMKPEGEVEEKGKRRRKNNNNKNNKNKNKNKKNKKNKKKKQQKQA